MRARFNLYRRAWKAAPALVRIIAAEDTGIPGIAAIREARRAIDELGMRGQISLIYAGGIRNGGDVAKALALGADAIAIGHSV